MNTILFASLMLATPPSADEAIASALSKAEASHKNVFVHFTASWCPWCHKLDQLLSDPRLGPAFAKSYEFVPITVRERADKRANENSGWAATMQRLRGSDEQDVPYVVVLSPKSEKLSDSFRPKEGRIPGNAGYPRTTDEISAFLEMIQKTGHGFNAADRATLKEYLQRSK